MSSTDTIAFSLVLVGSITFLFIISQIAVKELNPENAAYTWDGVNCQNNFLSGAMTGDCTANGTYSLMDPRNKLPGESTTVSGTGNIFTDTYVSAKNWLLDTTGLGFLGDILAAPKNFGIAIGLPTAAAYGLAAIWYMTLLFLLVAWALGR